MKHKKIEDSDFELFIKNEIESISDLHLLILKGHVLIEYSMIKFIGGCSDESFDVYKENFHFSQKIRICKAFSLFKSTKYPLEDLIITFNTIRNHIAHYLEYNESDLKKLINIFKQMSLNVRPVNEDATDSEIIKEMIPSICGLIIGIKLSKQKIAKFTNYVLSNHLKKNEQSFINELRNFT